MPVSAQITPQDNPATITPAPASSTPVPSTSTPAPGTTTPAPSTSTPNPASSTAPPVPNPAVASNAAPVANTPATAEPPPIQKTIVNPFVPGGVVYGRGAIITREEMLMLLDAREKKIKEELVKGGDLSKLSAALSGTAAANGQAAITAVAVGCFNGKAMLRDTVTQQIRLVPADDPISKANHCQEGAE